MKQKLFYFNWKMNPETLSQNLLDAYLTLEQKGFNSFKLFPPSLYTLAVISSGISPSHIGVQAVSHNSDTHGAYTGQLSTKMISHLYGSLVGHSETRMYYNHNFEEFKLQAKYLLSHNLGCVYCVGHSDTKDKEEIEKRALTEIIELYTYLLEAGVDTTNLIIAYEPIWAIGTGITASTQEIDTYFELVRKEVKALNSSIHLTLLYGGSVSSKTVDEQVKSEQIDGFLIGGSSLKPSELEYFSQYMS